MRRGVKTYTTLRAALTDVTLFALLTLLFAGGLAYPAAAVASFAYSIVPVYLLLSGLIAGLLPMTVCLAMTLIALLATGGLPLLGFGALYLLPMIGAFVYCLRRGARFWAACGALTAALAGAQMAIFLILQAMTGGALYAAAAGRLAEAINTMPGRDALLATLCDAGLLGLPLSMRDTALVAVEGGYVFSPEAVGELLSQVRSIVMQLLAGLLPSALVSGSGLSALLGLSLGVYYGRRAAQRRAVRLDEEVQPVPDFAMPPLWQWHIPRPWGLRIGLMAAGYLLMNVAPGGALFLLGALMWQTFLLCYSVQGLASVSFTQRRRGTSRFWRTAVIVAALLLPVAQVILLVLGILDQITNARGLRPSKAPRDGEE